MSTSHFLIDTGLEFRYQSKILPATRRIPMGALRSSREPRRLTEAIEAIYDGVLDPPLWRQAIESARAYVQADSALLRVYGDHWGSALQSMSTGFDPAFSEAYRLDFIHEDPIVTVLEALPLGRMVILEHELPPSRVETLHFYQEYMKSPYKRHGLGGLLLRVGGSSVMVGFQRAHDAPAFTVREQRRAQALVPHWVRALKLAERLRQEQTQARMTETLLGDAAPGMLLFDVHGHVIYLNPAAERLLSRQDQLTLRNQRFYARSRRLQSWLDATLVAKNRKHRSGSWEGSSARFTSSDRSEDIALALLPWHGGIALACGCTQAVTAGILTTLRLQGPFSVPMIESLFGLSPGEARLAEALTRTGSLSLAAEELGIQISTARDRLKTVFHKTGFDSQVALVTAILRSPVLPA